MKRLAPCLLVAALLAQEPATESAPAAPAERNLTGIVDFGYRALGGVRGDFNTYRSVVNLGEGPKLFALDASLEDPTRRLFDRLDLRMNSWGGDPYNTARLEAVRNQAYRFTLDYRNIQYFNFLPSFADPSIERGVFLNQRALDTYRRANDMELTLLPGRRIMPYAAYSRNSSRGRGITTFVLDANEYPVPHMLRDHSDSVRGGLRAEFPRWHLRLEGGGMTYHIDQQVYTFPERNFGNVFRPILGQTLVLDRGNQALDVRGSSRFASAAFSAQPFSWVELAGQFQFSQPETETRYAQNNTGAFVDFARLVLYQSQLTALDSRAKQPHSSGSFSAEIRPLRRVRIIEAWMTDRLHNAGSALLTDRLLISGQPLDAATLASAERLAVDYNRQEVIVLVDVTRRLTLRGGHRYVWGESETPPPLILPELRLPRAELRQHVALGGASLHFAQRLRVAGDLEVGSADRSYFRTSLHDYRRGRVRAQYQIHSSLAVTLNFGVLKNTNPTPSLGYRFLSRQNTAAMQWTPGGGKWVSLLGEYTRYTLNSEITYLDPGAARGDWSIYRERGHAATALLETALPGRGAVRPKVTLGGSLVVGAGTRPARYYQPLGRLAIPFHRHGEWYGEWRWYAFSQPFYSYNYTYEAFRNHQFVTGFRLTM